MDPGWHRASRITLIPQRKGTRVPDRESSGKGQGGSRTREPAPDALPCQKRSAAEAVIFRSRPLSSLEVRS